MKKRLSRPIGALNGATTEIHPDTLSTNAEPLAETEVTLATSGDSVEQKSPLDSQLTPNSMISTQSEESQADAKMLIMFGEKLVPLVEWQRTELVDGRTGTMLFFDDTKWFVDPVGKKLIPR